MACNGTLASVAVVGCRGAVVVVELSAVHPGGRYFVDSGSGTVTVFIPPDADLDLKLDASFGRIDYKGLPLSQIRHDDGDLEATLNRGGARLAVDAGSCRIILRPYLGLAKVKRVLQMVDEEESA